MVPVYPSEAKRESLRRWILIDAAGNCTVIEGFKHMIMQRFQINARDLRVLDPIISSPSSILIRAKAIVLNLEHVKVIISAKEVLIGDPNHPDVVPVVKEFRRHLERRGQADRKENSSAEDDADTAEKDETPFEFRALEVALEAICSSLGARATQLEMSAYPALDELTTTISSLNLERVRQLKNWITKLNVRVQKVRDVLEQLLGDDDDMADFYLSRKSSLVSDSGESIDCDFTEDRSNKNSGPKKKKGATVTRAKSLLVNPLPTVRGNDKNDVEEVEMLLEAYFMKIESTWNKLTAVREYIDDTEDYINIQLDSKRNQLIKFEIILSAGSICVSVYSLVVGILGMNIPYSWNTKEYMFKWVVSVTTTLCAVLFVIILWYARYKRLIGI